MTERLQTEQLISTLHDARARTLELISDLSAEQLIGPKLPTVNPLQWEIGHVAYFYEYFILRELYGANSIIGDRADQLYDSIAVAHDTRWNLPLLSMPDTLTYMSNVLNALCERLDHSPGLASEQDSFIYQFGAFHEDMHTEAFLWARQKLGYQRPALAGALPKSAFNGGGSHPGFCDIPGGEFELGARPDAAFLFDNEKYAHPVSVAPFTIAKAPVTNDEFAEFIRAGGYTSDHFWSSEGLGWRRAQQATHPIYWQPTGAQAWAVRQFDQLSDLAPNEPVMHVTCYEAEAFCEWAGLRLPSELEWEVAALGEPDSNGNLSAAKRRYPWGDETPGPRLANLDGRALGSIDVGALAAGDSAFGCRQMLGNCWEWTATPFQPFPGFEPDAYREYSQMLFATTRVLRGGAWTTRSRMIHGTYRNFFEPNRSNVFGGFRTCRR